MNNKIIIPSEYDIPDGGDINIYCEYSDKLKENINEAEIKEFFKENGKNVDVKINIDVEESNDYKLFISVSDKNSDSVAVMTCWKNFDDDDKNEYVEAYKESNLINEEEILNIFNNCNSYILFDCLNSEEVFMVMVLATYLSRYSKYLIITDTYNGIDLKPSGNELIIMN